MLKIVHGTYTDKEKEGEPLNKESLQPFAILPRLKGLKSKEQQCTISPSTLHGWKVKYFQELAKK